MRAHPPTPTASSSRSTYTLNFRMSGRMKGRKRVRRPTSLKQHDEGLQTHLREFREIFDLFDMNEDGSLNPSELDKMLKEIGIELTQADLHQVMEIAEGNGEDIALYEFVAVVTNMAAFIHGTKSGEFSKEKIYSVLVKFMRKSALSCLSDIRARGPSVYDHTKQPVLLEHYFVGARLDGLTEKQVMKKYEELKLSQSPYNSRGSRGSYPGAYRSSLLKFRSSRDAEGRVVRVSSDGLAMVQLNEAMKLLSPKSKQVNNTMVVIPQQSSTDKDTTKQSDRKKKVFPPQKRLMTGTMCLREVVYPSGPFAVSFYPEPTVSDLPVIRKKVTLEHTEYCQEQVRHRKERLKKYNPFTDLSAIPSQQLRYHFKKALEAYGYKTTNSHEFLTYW